MQYRIPAILIILSPTFLASVSDAQSRSNARRSAAPTFQQMPGALTQISVGCGVWGVNSSGEAFYYNDASHGWIGDDRQSVAFSQIVAGGSGSFNDSWAIAASHVPYSHGVRNSSDGSRSTSSWDSMDWPHFVNIASDFWNVWGIDESNRVFRYMKGHGEFFQIPGSLVQIASIGGNFEVQAWGLDKANHIYKFHDAVGGHGTFEQVPGELIQIAVGNTPRAIEAWGINSAHQIYRYSYTTQSFEQVPGALATIAVGIAGVWGLNDSGEIYRFNASTNAFERVPGNLKQISLAPGCDDGVWGINSRNEVFKLSVATDAMQYQH